MIGGVAAPTYLRGSLAASGKLATTGLAVLVDAVMQGSIPGLLDL